MKKTMKHKFIILASVAAIAAAPMAARAASVHIDALANFIAAVTLTKVTDMDFGDIEFAAAPTGADTVTMSTAGALSYGGSAFSGGTTATSYGEVTLTGTNTYTVDVSCSASATLAEAGGVTIDVNNITINDGTSDHTCLGIGGGTVFSIGTTGAGQSLKLGGTIDGGTVAGGTFVAGQYSTATGGGTDIQIDAVYQ